MAMTFRMRLQDDQCDISQSLIRPVVYLDHWAVRLFAEDQQHGERFASALQSSGGTWLLSQHNLSEFCAHTDLTQARSVELFIERVLPNFYIADFTIDPGFGVSGAPSTDPDCPGEHWLLRVVGEHSALDGGKLSAKGLVSTIVQHRERMLREFNSLKTTVAGAVSAMRADRKRMKEAQQFKPTHEMSVSRILMAESLRDVHLNPAAKFEENDVLDLLHTVGSVPVADYALLDRRWCDKVEKARRRMISAGVQRHVARVYSRKTVELFLRHLEAQARPAA